MRRRRRRRRRVCKRIAEGGKSKLGEEEDQYSFCQWPVSFFLSFYYSTTELPSFPPHTPFFPQTPLSSLLPMSAILPCWAAPLPLYPSFLSSSSFFPPPSSSHHLSVRAQSSAQLHLKGAPREEGIKRGLQHFSLGPLLASPSEKFIFCKLPKSREKDMGRISRQK